MSDSMSPYQPPASGMDENQVMSANVSVIPKVFGILHLVFGGLGFVFGILGLIGAIAGKQVEDIKAFGGGEAVEQEMEEAVQPLYDAQIWDVASNVVSLILAFLLVFSGLKLVRYRIQGLKISNIYSLLSVIHKVGVILMVILVVAPAMTEIAESMEEIGGDTAGMSAVMGPAVVVGGVLMAVLMMVYPVLSYFMLNKKQAKESLR